MLFFVYIFIHVESSYSFSFSFSFFFSPSSFFCFWVPVECSAPLVKSPDSRNHSFYVRGELKMPGSCASAHLFFASSTYSPSVSHPYSLFIHSLVQSLTSKKLNCKDRKLESIESIRSIFFWCKCEKCKAEGISCLLRGAWPAQG